MDSRSPFVDKIVANVSHPAPIVLKPLGGEKAAALQADMVLLAQAAGVKDEARWAEFVTAYKALETAIIPALSDEGPVAHAFAHLMDKEGDSHIPPLSPEALHAQNFKTMQSIFKNRRDDAESALAVLADPAFLQQTYQGIISGALKPSAEIPPLAKDKVQELAETMLPPGKFEPAAHINFTAEGHQRGHAILAKAFDPKGPALELLATAIQQEAPSVNKTMVGLFAERWLTIRGTRAQQVADGYYPESPVVTEVLAESERRRLATGKPIPAPQPSPVAAIMERGPRQPGEPVPADTYRGVG